MNIKNAIKTIIILGTAYYTGRIIENAKWQRATGLEGLRAAQVHFGTKKI